MAFFKPKSFASVKNRPKAHVIRYEPGEDEIRSYAYHLYMQSSRVSDHAFEDWLEAKASLKAKIPTSQSRTRLHRHVNGA
jgi:hypothetical protein